MKYYMNLRSRPSGEDPTAGKMSDFVNQLALLPAGWAIDIDKVGNLTVMQPYAGRNLTRALPRSVSGHFEYNYKGVLDDTGMCDDFLILEFDPEKVEFSTFVDDATPFLIDAFTAYRLKMIDLETLSIDHGTKRTSTNARQNVGRLGIVNYFDRKLCKRAFGLTPAATVKCVKNEVEVAKTLHDGAYIALSRTPLKPRDLRRQGKSVRILLPNSPF